MQFLRSLRPARFRLALTACFLVWTLILTPAFGLAASALNFPRLSGVRDELTGIALVNPNNQLATVIFTAYGTSPPRAVFSREWPS